MPFVTRLLHTGWRVQAKRDWANSPNEWAILRPSANGTTWKRSLEKKVWPGSKFGVLSVNLFRWFLQQVHCPVRRSPFSSLATRILVRLLEFVDAGCRMLIGRSRKSYSETSREPIMHRRCPRDWNRPC